MKTVAPTSNRRTRGYLQMTRRSGLVILCIAGSTLAGCLGCHSTDGVGERSPSASVGDNAPAFRDESAPIKTNASSYRLDSASSGYRAEIGFTFTNRTGSPVYVIN